MLIPHYSTLIGREVFSLVRLPSFELGCPAYETGEIANTSPDA